MDHISKEHRSWNMSRIKSTNSKPEIIVRSLLHRQGFRFRLYGKVSKRLYSKGILPGKPDIVLAKYKTVIFIHGCFWHRHPSASSGTCKRATIPKTRTEWWLKKFESNVQRDERNIQELESLGWEVIVIWECEVLKGDFDALEVLIKGNLNR
ncbi:MAG: DNA mismatch endonuclease Vsr [Spirochaetaceae bacterium]|jgi:DNA mismatch endonuclease (patch repair protein)|nr:DNA mismatch endonuclease Vsr [Spirochaetaceae bacterium]